MADVKINILMIFRDLTLNLLFPSSLVYLLHLADAWVTLVPSSPAVKVAHKTKSTLWRKPELL